jgi:hypothetical protein
VEVDDEILNSSDLLDKVLIIFFCIECLMKTIAFGFVLSPNSYLRESWSQLDFFIVVTSVIDLLISDINLGFVKIFRLLRTLRPLRFITHNRNLKLIVATLLKSAGGLVNVGGVVILVWAMFAILGINLKKGSSHFCSLGGY